MVRMVGVFSFWGPDPQGTMTRGAPTRAWPGAGRVGWVCRVCPWFPVCQALARDADGCRPAAGGA